MGQVGSFEVMDTCGNMAAMVPRWSNPDAPRCGRAGSTIAGQSVLSPYAYRMSWQCCATSQTLHLQMFFNEINIYDLYIFRQFSTHIQIIHSPSFIWLKEYAIRVHQSAPIDYD